MKKLNLITALALLLMAGLVKAQGAKDPSTVAPQQDYHRSPQPTAPANTVTSKQAQKKAGNATAPAQAAPNAQPGAKPAPIKDNTAVGSGQK